MIENKRIVELPLNGRNYLQLVSLAPNVSTGFAGQGQAAARQGGIRAAQTISVAGQRTNFNHYTLDGVENTDPNFNTFVVMPSIDALQEFKVQTGVYPGGVRPRGHADQRAHQIRHQPVSRRAVRVLPQRQARRHAATPSPPCARRRTLSSGTSTASRWAARRHPEAVQRQGQALLHGQLRGVSASAAAPPALFSLASAADAGRRLLRHHATDLRSASHVLGADGKTITATPFPGNIIPQTASARSPSSCWSSIARPRCPVPSTTTSQALPRPDNRDQFILRMDYVESSKSTWTGRYSWGDENSSSPGPEPERHQAAHQFRAVHGLQHARVLAVRGHRDALRLYALLQFRRHAAGRSAERGGRTRHPRTEAAAIPSPGAFRPSAFPITHGIGDSTDGPFVNKNNTLQFLNNTSITRGKHAFRFGGEIRRDQYNQDRQPVRARQFHLLDHAHLGSRHQQPAGDAFASFLLGNVTLTEVAAQIASVQLPRRRASAFYVDDVWKITPKLTLSLGLRYENTPPWTDQSGNLMTVYFNAYDTTPNVADQSRYPVFLRQGKGSGDPYAGLRVRWPNIPLVQDGRLGDSLVQSRQQRFRSAHRHRLESRTPKWAHPPGRRHVLQPGPGQPAVRCRPQRRRPLAQRRQSVLPGRNLGQRAGLCGLGERQHHHAAGLLHQVRPPHALLHQ